MFNYLKKKKRGIAAVQSAIALVIVIAGLVLISLEPVITGYIPYESLTVEGNISAVNNKSMMVVTHDSSDILSLSSIKISGKVIGQGLAKVYLKTEDGEKHLIFSSENLPKEPGMIHITGFTPGKGKSVGKGETPKGQEKKESEEKPEKETPTEEPEVE